ncbi:hypothetical protein GCM10009678_86500 [Actinomadura kijaniata]|uniref:hypothetical protein n=1 Tax=Actinomadura kijaniata TaxID=46161 RepID=UPI002FECDD99
MRTLTLLADRVERSPLARETVNALADGAYWGWAVALLAAAAAWAGRGAPSPGTAALAAAAIAVGVGAAALRSWRRTDPAAAPAARRLAATMAARRWATGYGLIATIVPISVMAGDGRASIAVTVAYIVALVLLGVALLTLQPRARARLLARLRIGVRAVAGTEHARVGRALWTGMALQRVLITYPADWSAHRSARRDELVERVMWELCGPPPASPRQALGRPDYLTRWDHINTRLIVERVPSLPPRLPARDFGQHGAIVLGQTVAEDADQVIDGVPVALYEPTAHLLVAGATQHGKSSGVRAWAVDGLGHGVFPGGILAVLDGKGSGSFAPLIGRQGVGPVAHTPEEWEQALLQAVVPEVDRRYAQMLAWRSGQSTQRPHHPRALVVLDEIQQILAARPDLLQVFDRLARQALEAGVILWVLTQRPDARDAIPGAVRDQLTDRVTFGPLSGAGAKMVFDVVGDDWARGMGVAPLAGRALTWMGGRWRPVQAPWLPMPVDIPQVEALYPPHTGQQPTPEPEHPPAPAAPSGDPWRGYGPPPPPPQTTAPPEPSAEPRRWPPPSPRPAAEPPGPVEELLRDYGDPPPTPEGPDDRGQAEALATYNPNDPYAHRRRRRRD